MNRFTRSYSARAGLSRHCRRDCRTKRARDAGYGGPDVVHYRPAQNGLTAKEFFSYYEVFMKYFIMVATPETPSRWQ